MRALVSENCERSRTARAGAAGLVAATAETSAPATTTSDDAPRRPAPRAARERQAAAVRATATTAAAAPATPTNAEREPGQPERRQPSRRAPRRPASGARRRRPRAPRRRRPASTYSEPAAFTSSRCRLNRSPGDVAQQEPSAEVVRRPLPARRRTIVAAASSAVEPTTRPGNPGGQRTLRPRERHGREEHTDAGQQSAAPSTSPVSAPRTRGNPVVPSAAGTTAATSGGTPPAPAIVSADPRRGGARGVEDGGSDDRPRPSGRGEWPPHAQRASRPGRPTRRARPSAPGVGRQQRTGGRQRATVRVSATAGRHNVTQNTSAAAAAASGKSSGAATASATRQRQAAPAPMPEDDEPWAPALRPVVDVTAGSRWRRSRDR